MEYVVASKPVPNLRAFALGLDEVRVAKNLEMLRDAGDRHIGLARQGFDMTRRLGEEIEQFEAAVARKGMADTGEEGIKPLLEGAV